MGKRFPAEPLPPGWGIYVSLSRSLRGNVHGWDCAKECFMCIFRIEDSHPVSWGDILDPPYREEP